MIDQDKEYIKCIETALHNYSCYFVDWEELYNNKSYHPNFPSDLVEAILALQKLKASLDRQNDQPRTY